MPVLGAGAAQHVLSTARLKVKRTASDILGEDMKIEGFTKMKEGTGPRTWVTCKH